MCFFSKSKKEKKSHAWLWRGGQHAPRDWNKVSSRFNRYSLDLLVYSNILVFEIILNFGKLCLSLRHDNIRSLNMINYIFFQSRYSHSFTQLHSQFGVLKKRLFLSASRNKKSWRGSSCSYSLRCGMLITWCTNEAQGISTLNCILILFTFFRQFFLFIT